jgi:hypothetical protein
MEGYKAVKPTSEDHSKVGRSLLAQCQAVADMKFTYVVSCQQYGIQKRSGDKLAQDILQLMTTYSSCTYILCICVLVCIHICICICIFRLTNTKTFAFRHEVHAAQNFIIICLKFKFILLFKFFI